MGVQGSPKGLASVQRALTIDFAYPRSDGYTPVVESRYFWISRSQSTSSAFLLQEPMAASFNRLPPGRAGAQSTSNAFLLHVSTSFWRRACTACGAGRGDGEGARGRRPRREAESPSGGRARRAMSIWDPPWWCRGVYWWDCDQAPSSLPTFPPALPRGRAGGRGGGEEARSSSLQGITPWRHRSHGLKHQSRPPSWERVKPKEIKAMARQDEDRG